MTLLRFYSRNADTLLNYLHNIPAILMFKRHSVARSSYTYSDNDVISSYFIYASCFSAMIWGKLREIFVTVTSLLSKIVIIGLQTFS